MRQIRRGVFETNSSSSHSITVCRDNDFEPSALRTDVNGYVRARFGEWGWSFHDVTTQYERLSYILTMARILTECNESVWACSKKVREKDKRNFEVTREFKEISDAVAAHTPDCVGVRIDVDDYDTGDIDHDSSNSVYSSFEEFLLDNNMTVEQFIFGDGSMVTDGHGEGLM